MHLQKDGRLQRMLKLEVPKPLLEVDGAKVNLQKDGRLLQMLNLEVLKATKVDGAQSQNHHGMLPLNPNRRQKVGADKVVLKEKMTRRKKHLGPWENKHHLWRQVLILGKEDISTFYKEF